MTHASSTTSKMHQALLKARVSGILVGDDQLSNPGTEKCPRLVVVFRGSHKRSVFQIAI